MTDLLKFFTEPLLQTALLENLSSKPTLLQN